MRACIHAGHSFRVQVVVGRCHLSDPSHSASILCAVVFELLIVPQIHPGEQLERTQHDSLFNCAELIASGFKTTCFITFPCIKSVPLKIIVSKSSKRPK